MVTFSLDEETTVQKYQNRNQSFYFVDNSNLCLSLLDNKDKTSSVTYVYDNSLDKNKLDELHDDSDEHEDQEDREEDRVPSSDRHKLKDEVDMDEILDKVFDLYDKYKEIKKGHSEKLGKSGYLKNESKILTNILKKEQEEKSVLLKKLDNLSHIYKDRHIKIDSKEPLYRLKKLYDSEIERIYGESQIESNKDYIKYVFLSIEIVCNYIGFDMSGYTKFNMDRINKYEAILVEIGAIQSLIRLNTLHPVVKLALLFSFNTLCFIGVKVAIKYDKTGGQIFNSVSNVFGSFLSSPTPASNGNPTRPNTQPSTTNQPRMNGPRMNGPK